MRVCGLVRNVRLAFMVTLVFVSFSFVVVLPSEARADEAGIQELQTIFNDMLEEYKVSVGDGAELKLDGNVVVEEQDFYYFVTLPHM